MAGETHHATMCSLPLDLTSVSGFTTAGRSVTRRSKRHQFMWNLFCINMEIVLWKCCTVFTIHCKSFYFLHVLHTGFHYISLKQYTRRMTSSNKTSQEIFMREMNQWSLWIISHISNHYFELFNWTTSENKLSNGYAAAPAQAEIAAFGMASCLYSCHYKYFMQHQHPPHHPIFTIFITKKEELKVWISIYFSP